MKFPVVAKKVKNAEAARDRLQAALKGVGVVLPSFRIVPLSCTKECSRQLIDLGPCAVDTACAIAAALESAAQFPPDAASSD